MAKFEENLTALETVVERLERGDLSLEESVKLFEEGVTLSTACKTELDAAEGRIQLLVEQGKGQMAVAELEVDEYGVGEEEDET
jgi:exodeoxyribonuclease VII small subunit